MRRSAVVIVLAAALLDAANAAAAPCDDVAKLAMPSATITSAQVVEAGAFPVPAGMGAQPAAALATLPAFCRVSLTLKPSADSDIRSEVWLPAANWNRKLQVAGNGAWAGILPYAIMANALAAGYATAGTDTGHVGNNSDFVPGHPERLVDYAYRAVHETTVAAKTLINSYYGNAATFSYFRGCSTGGRQALTSAQRYPQDFDGIVAIASAFRAMRNHGGRLVFNNFMNRSDGSAIPPDKYPAVHEAVLNACDALDGVKDGVIENPTKCRVDFERIACKGEDTTSCLTAAQIESARAMLSPVTDPRTGTVVWEGHLWPGSELRWDVLAGPQPFPNAATAMKNLLHGGDAQWNPRSFTVADIERADKADGDLLDASNPDIRPFFERGGKLLMFHGWADPEVTPQTSTMYFTSVLKAVGKRAEDSIALFMMPGVYHCQGGPGPDRFDRMADIEQWVERGRKPTRIVVSHLTNGTVDRTRPLCPFGQVARWNGSGSTDDEKNFACVAETVDTSVRPAAPTRRR